MSPSLDSFIAIPVPHGLYIELARRYPSRVSTVVENVVQDFLDRTAQDFESASPKDQGIHWESVFLPEGTQIRTKYFGDYRVAEIVAAQIMWNGNSFPSMSRLARSMRGNTSNNAWKVLEIKRPSDATWELADYLRR